VRSRELALRFAWWAAEAAQTAWKRAVVLLDLEWEVRLPSRAMGEITDRKGFMGLRVGISLSQRCSTQ